MTDLWTRERVPKNDCRIEAIGQLDSAQAWIGKFYAEQKVSNSACAIKLCTLFEILRCFHAIMACVALPNRGTDPESSKSVRVESYIKMLTEHTTVLEEESLELESTLPPLSEFILPICNSSVHIARTSVRTAERAVWTVENLHKGSIHHAATTYLNRVSDYLFLAARAIQEDEKEK